MKKTHGGKRPNAGRKSKFPNEEMISYQKKIPKRLKNKVNEAVEMVLGEPTPPTPHNHTN